MRSCVRARSLRSTRRFYLRMVAKTTRRQAPSWPPPSAQPPPAVEIHALLGAELATARMVVAHQVERIGGGSGSARRRATIVDGAPTLVDAGIDGRVTDPVAAACTLSA